MWKTLEEYLREHMETGTIDHQIRARVTPDGRVTFYIHPDSENGTTEDYEVSGNVLAHDRDMVRIEV